MFDLRHLEHSTIIYEDPQRQPLLRLAWNKQDPNYLATMAMDALEVGNSVFLLCSNLLFYYNSEAMALVILIVLIYKKNPRKVGWSSGARSQKKF